MLHRNRARVIHVIHLTAFMISLGLGAACDEDVPDERDDASAEPVAPQAQSGAYAGEWRADVHSAEPALRAAAVAAIPVEPGRDGLAVVEALLGDPEPMVRGQAVASLAHLLRLDAVPRLREIALKDPDPDVASFARAELRRVRLDANEPPRGFVDVVHPESFAVGRPFELRVRFGASVDVPGASVRVRLPRGFELMGPAEPRWRGEIGRGDRRELVFLVKPAAPVESKIRLRLELEFPEQLDVEVLERSLDVAVDGDHGSLADDGPPSVGRR